ncbi:hypothetical protein Tcan_13899 [Toxocara canis]|uniref:Uncharacterized protein n=1 Tax=Toxocara canis TaxID=6265 RepID=A0A0B2V1J8_TOXCA|nr:hypothetical protein Tcan_13899 [Toxocara canis]
MLERILIGLLFILMDTIGLITVIIIIVTILLERSLRQSQCYQMILYVCVLDAVQLLVDFISGFLTIWPPHNKISTKVYRTYDSMTVISLETSILWNNYQFLIISTYVVISFLCLQG